MQTNALASEAQAVADVTTLLMLEFAIQDLATDLYVPESIAVMRDLAQDWASVRVLPPTFCCGMYVSQSAWRLSPL